MATKKTEAKSTSNTVGRQELSRRIAKDAELSQKQAQAALETTLKAIREALESGSEVRFVGSIPRNPSGKILRRQLRELL